MASLSLISRSLSRELISDAPCGFLSSDSDGKVIYANATLSRWLGYESGSLPDKITVQEVFSESSKLYYEAQIVPMLNIQRFAHEISCKLAVRNTAQSLPVLMNAKIREATKDALERIDFVFFDATQRLQFEATLREARSEAEELAAIVQTASVGILRVDHDGRLKRWNAAAEAIINRTKVELPGKSICEVLDLGDTDDEWFQLAKVALGNKSEHRFDSNHHDEIFLNIAVAEIVNIDDPLAQSDYSIVLRDISNRVRDSKRLNLMVQEMDHRVKNNLAIVSALVSQSLRGQALSAEREKLINRIQNVSASHEILTTHFWDNVDISEVIKPLQTLLDDPERIVFSGSKIQLSPNQFKGISMAFHELTTNALKYGALSNESGRVSICWKFVGSGNKQLSILWEEAGGPLTRAPEKTGFGTTMIESVLLAEFEGSTEFDFQSEGLRFNFLGTI